MEENDPYLILHRAKAGRNGHLAQSQLSVERRVALIYEFARSVKQNKMGE